MTEILVPGTAVPQGQSQGQVKKTVAGVKEFTKREAEMLASIGSLKNGSVIVEEIPAAPAAPKAAETVPEESGSVDTVVIPNNEVVEGEPIVTDQNVEDDGYEYGTMFEGDGKLEYRKSKESGVQEVKTIIDGVEEWITPQAYKRGYQLNMHNNREARRLAEERKELQERKEIDDIINKFKVTSPSPKPDSSELDFSEFGNEDEPVSKKPESSELAEIKKELAELRADRKKNLDAEHETAVRQQKTMLMSATYEQTKEFCKGMGVILPKEPDNRIVARVKAYSESMGMEPLDVATNPVYMIEALKSFKGKPISPQGEEPPKALKGKPNVGSEPSELQKLTTKKKALQEQYKNPKLDSADITAELLAVDRRIIELKGS